MAFAATIKSLDFDRSRRSRTDRFRWAENQELRGDGEHRERNQDDVKFLARENESSELDLTPKPFRSWKLLRWGTSDGATEKPESRQNLAGGSFATTALSEPSRPVILLVKWYKTMNNRALHR